MMVLVGDFIGIDLSRFFWKWLEKLQGVRV
jgi:hypothetical protein